MRILVTGGAGFIGANLCRSLEALDEVEQVLALDDLSTGDFTNLLGLERTKLVEASVLDRPTLDQVVGDVTAVVHLAARPSVPRSLSDPVATHRANTDGTVAVLEAVRRRPPADRPYLVVASSSSVYGANETLPKREDMVVRPVSPYAASKLATESYALAYGASFEMEVLVFRFFNVFGPLQGLDHPYAAVVPCFIAAALRGGPLTIHGDGRQSRDFTFVGSVVSVLVDSVIRRVCHETPVNLAFGTRISILELASALEKTLGRPLPRRHVEPRPGDVKHSQADTVLLRSMFPHLAPVPLEAGLQETVAWARREIDGT